MSRRRFTAFLVNCGQCYANPEQNKFEQLLRTFLHNGRRRQRSIKSVKLEKKVKNDEAASKSELHARERLSFDRQAGNISRAFQDALAKARRFKLADVGPCRRKMKLIPTG